MTLASTKHEDFQNGISDRMPSVGTTCLLNQDSQSRTLPLKCAVCLWSGVRRGREMLPQQGKSRGREFLLSRVTKDHYDSNG